MKTALINVLENRLKGPLPGPEAQYKMAHAVRRSAQLPPPNATLAGVLALFYPQGQDWRLVLIERQANNPNDRHKGQISFPGGRFDASDGRLMQTALREAREEVGVDPQSVRILGSLTDLYIPVSNFLVHPFVGFAEEAPVFEPQLSEVKRIIEVPLELLRDVSNIQTMDMRISEHITLKDVPYYNLQGDIVWGATAMMLSELLELLDGI